MLASFEETNAGPTLQRQLEIDPCGCEIYECTGMIHGEILIGLGLELLELLRIRAADPSGGMDVDVLERALHTVFVLQAKRHDFELQLADRTKDQVIVP